MHIYKLSNQLKDVKEENISFTLGTKIVNT